MWFLLQRWIVAAIPVSQPQLFFFLSPHCRERTSLCTALMTGINFLTQDHFYPSHLWNMSDRIRTWEGSQQARVISQGNSFLLGVYFSIKSFLCSPWERHWAVGRTEKLFLHVFILKVLSCSPVARMKCQHLMFLQTVDVFTCVRFTIWYVWLVPNVSYHMHIMFFYDLTFMWGGEGDGYWVTRNKVWVWRRVSGEKKSQDSSGRTSRGRTWYF